MSTPWIRWLLLSGAVLSLCTSCVGEIIRPKPGTKTTTTPPGSYDPSFTCGPATAITPTAIRRQAKVHYVNSITEFLSQMSSADRAALMGALQVQISLIPEDASNFYSRNDTSVTQSHAGAAFDLAFALGSLIAANDTYVGELAAVCGAGSSRTSLTGTCANTFVSYYALKAFRRPVTAAETADLLTDPTSTTTPPAALDLTTQQGLTSLLVRLLAHPRFFYRLDDEGTLVSGTDGTSGRSSRTASTRSLPVTGRLARVEASMRATWLSWGAAAICATLAACSSGTEPDMNLPGTEPQVVFIPDASVCACASEKETCNANVTCCGNLVCRGGVCIAAEQPACARFGQTCSGSMPCCVAPPPDGGWPVGSVPPVAGCGTNTKTGLSTCTIGVTTGDPCGVGTWGCANGLVCVNSQCVEPGTGVTCPRPVQTTDGGADGGADSGTVSTDCVVGDDCYRALLNTCNAGNCQDPCLPYGLVCLSTNTSYVCKEPTAYVPPFFPLINAGSDYSICRPGLSVCQPYPGEKAAVGCGSTGVPALQFGRVVSLAFPVCVQLCQSPDDCGSRAWDCLAGQCLPNYCFALPDSAGDDIATAISGGQTGPVTADAGVLFKPCTNGGPNTYCMPQNDNLWNTTTGICYRLGGPDAGGVGASCDRSALRSDEAAQCRPGTLCLKGTCQAWCDTGGLITCAGGQQCLPVGHDLVSSTANPHGAGACIDTCDPYQDAQHQSCPATPCGTPSRVCKPSGVDNDVFPSPGLCAGGVLAPVPVGAGCNPSGRLDPCVSGALCTLTTAGTGYVCAQMCDPNPSAQRAATVPRCISPTQCQALGSPVCASANGGPCNHMGVCL